MGFEKLKKFLPTVQQNISLAEYTTFKIGGPAKYFFIAKNEKDLIKAIKTAKEFNLSFFILGSGSNILVSDRGYKGLVIKIKKEQVPRKREQKSKIKNNLILAGAGVSLSTVVKLAAEKSLTGLEWAIGLPGTLGGAVYGNTGAFGSQIADVAQSVKVFDIKKLKVKNFSAKQCQFGNKESIFKLGKNFIILSIVLKLKKGDKKEIESEIKRFSDYRKNNHPLNFPSAGCIFKNYNKKIKNKKLLKKYPELIEFNKGSRIPVSYLIDKCGLKGKKIGRAEVSKKHANFIVNLGGAKAKDVVNLINLIKKEVKKKFNINLEEEIQYLK